MRLPAATRRDAPELLAVHMHEVAGARVLIAADHPPRGAVEPGEPVEAEAAEHPVDRRACEAQPVGDADGAELEAAAQAFDAALGRARRAVGAAVRTAGPVEQACIAFRQPAPPPAVGGLAGDPHLSGDMGDRAPGGDALGEDAPSRGGELGVTVHAGPPGAGIAVVATPSPGGPLRSPAGVTNLCAQYI